MTVTQYMGANTNTGASPRLWAEVDSFANEIQGPGFSGHGNRGFGFFDDFLTEPGNYTETQATAGTAAIDSTPGEGGWYAIDCNSTTQHQGMQVQSPIIVFKPQALKKIVFEARFYISDHPDNVQFFLGLSELDTTIIASGANSSANHVGFESIAASSVVTGVGEKAGTRDTSATFDTLVDGSTGIVKYGFVIDELDTLTFYKNGTASTDTIATASIPIVSMALSAVCQTDGTTDPILYMDWWKCVEYFKYPK